MKPRYLLQLIVLLLFGACSTPQLSKSNLYADRYADQYAPGEVTVAGSYQHALTQLGGTYIRRSFFPATKTLTEYTEYSDRAFTTREGRYKDYFDEGELREEGQYHDNEKTGTWTTYYRNGQVSTTGEYGADGKVGQWLSYGKEGNLHGKYNYRAGEYDGEVTLYDKEGQLIRTTTYAMGEEVSTIAGPSPDAPEITNGLIMTGLERMPLFPGCEDITDYKERKTCADRKMLEHIYGAVRYPSHARNYGVEGMGIVKFVIEKDGSITDVEVVRGLDSDISNELIRIVNTMPKWEPGQQNGKPVRVQFNLPVNFKLT